MRANQNQDKAGKEYWNTMWKRSDIPIQMTPYSKCKVIDCAINKFMHMYLDDYVSAYNQINLLEVGCGNSAFLPYFAKEFKLNVWGLDYSEDGCATAKRNLLYYGQKGNIIQGDMFSPPENLLGKFDIVYSAGVIEHFGDTVSCCKALSRFLKRGGICITEIPNTCSESKIMKLQKMIDKDTYDIHYSLDSEMIKAAHETIGFETRYCDYTLASNYGVIKYPADIGIFMKGMKFLLSRWSLLIMHLKRDKIKGNYKTAPYIYYVGVK